MANSIQGRPWVLDMNSGSIPIKSGRTWVAGYRYRNYMTAGHQAIVKDGVTGVTVETLKGTSDLAPVNVFFVEPQIVQSISLPQIDSGVLEIFIK